MEENMTPNREDYLKTLYIVGGSGQLVTNKQIAERMKISPASVTEMLNKLNKEGLIEYQPYKGSKLTKKGLQKSIVLLRDHRLWEVFLIRHLGYSWSEAHEDAELLEHITPPRLASRLDKFLNYPAHCPHGSDIPLLSEEPKNVEMRILAELVEGDKSHIKRVTEEKDLLDYLQNIGIKIGAEFTILSVGDYEGPIVILSEKKQIQISYKAAQHIYVD